MIQLRQNRNYKYQSVHEIYYMHIVLLNRILYKINLLLPGVGSAGGSGVSGTGDGSVDVASDSVVSLAGSSFFK